MALLPPIEKRQCGSVPDMAVGAEYNFSAQALPVAPGGSIPPFMPDAPVMPTTKQSRRSAPQEMACTPSVAGIRQDSPIVPFCAYRICATCPIAANAKNVNAVQSPGYGSRCRVTIFRPGSPDRSRWGNPFHHLCQSHGHCQLQSESKTISAPRRCCALLCRIAKILPVAPNS